MAKFPMTPRGQQNLRDELKRLREVERPKNVLDIEEARAHGDLKENAEYHAAKERQGFIEGRSRDIESILAQAEVIDPSKLSGTKVVFGATVKLTDADSGDEVTYTVVGDHEADIGATVAPVDLGQVADAEEAAAGRQLQGPVAGLVPRRLVQLPLDDVDGQGRIVDDFGIPEGHDLGIAHHQVYGRGVLRLKRPQVQPFGLENHRGGLTYPAAARP